MRPGRASSFPHLPSHAHAHADLPIVFRSTGEQPKGAGREEEGGRAAWNLAIFDRNELEAAEGRGLSLTLTCCPSPGLVVDLQGSEPLTAPGSRSTLLHPAPSSLRSLVFTPQPLHCLGYCRLPPLPREQAPLGVALSSTLCKADSLQGPARRGGWCGIPVHIGPGRAHASLSGAHKGPSAQIPESLHSCFLIAVSLPWFFGGDLCFGELKAGVSRHRPL